jgi:hypothetical protein
LRHVCEDAFLYNQLKNKTRDDGRFRAVVRGCARKRPACKEMTGKVNCRIMNKAVLAVLVALITLPCGAQTRSAAADSRAEALVVCSEDLHPIAELTPYGFAKATLVSLWYARNASEHGDEIKQVKQDSDNPFSMVTAMMRITKTSTNDYICAKRPLKLFTKQTDETVQTASKFMTVVFDAHITINERLIKILKTLGNTNQGELMDQFSTLEVERTQRWADLVNGVSVVLMQLVDMNRTDEAGKTTRLIITKAQKQTLIDWIDEHFPEYRNGTAKDQWSEPAKTAQMYITVLNGRKCADE